MINENNKPDQDIIDASEYEADSDINSDIFPAEDIDDEESEDGIFAPEIAPKKKKGSSKATAFAVIAVALLGGGAFYYFNQGNQVVAPKPAPVSPPVENSAENAAVPPETDNAGAPVLSQENAAATDPASAAPSTPPGVGTISENAGTQPVTDNNAVTDVTLSQPSPTDEKAAVDLTNMNAPVAPSSTEEKPEIADDSTVAQNDKITAPAGDDVMGEKVSVAGADPQLAPPPIENTGAPDAENIDRTAAVAEVKSEKKKDVSLSQAAQSINLGKAKENKLEYYDAPKGKALLDIPPPSINPMSEPGQSIIIVHKNKTVAPSEAIIERGDQSGVVEARLTSASRASRLGKDDAAVDFYTQAYKKNPNDPRILMGRAVSYQKLGETEKAIQDYKDVLRIEPNNPEALTNLMGLVGEKKPAVALQNLLNLREKYPRNASVAAQLGVAYAQSGNQQDGIRYLKIASELQPDNPFHFYNMAVIADQMGEREQAIQYYEQALDVYSVNGSGSGGEFSREQVYDRLSVLRGAK